jgi:hypothetical protein
VEHRDKAQRRQQPGNSRDKNRQKPPGEVYKYSIKTEVSKLEVSCGFLSLLDMDMDMDMALPPK